MRFSKLSLAFVMLIICFAIFSTSAYPRTPGDLDRDIFNYVHKDLNNKFLDKATPIIQLMGDPKGYLGVCVLLCAFGNDKMYETGKMASAGFLESGLLAFAIKETVRRERPLNKNDKNSFPSGHSTVAFTLATIVSHQYPKLSVPLYLTAIGTGFSRVYLGKHYPSDVLAGAVLGTLIGIQIIHFKEPILSMSF
jgi:undecaprenyl-diphosphatase